MSNNFGYFDDNTSEFVITNPYTPKPWINYLTNSSLTCFVSQQAGGLAYYMDPCTRRITRYHYLPVPQDRPGFYVYIKDNTKNTLWNPHFAPTCCEIDFYECRHGLGYTTFKGKNDDIQATVKYFVPPDDNILALDVCLENLSDENRDISIASYIEFGLLEYLRETIAWCYLKHQFSCTYEEDENWIKYDYHAFESPFSPAIFFSCTEKADSYDCLRESFCGRCGSLEKPTSLNENGPTNSQATQGDHSCGVIGIERHVKAGERIRFAYILGACDDWEEAIPLRKKFSNIPAIEDAYSSLVSVWNRRTKVFHLANGEEHLRRWVNMWNPLSCYITGSLPSHISVDHTGLGGSRTRDKMQTALPLATIEPEECKKWIRLILSQQSSDGSTCFGFHPYHPAPREYEPKRCDNNVWPIYTVANLVNEEGSLDFLKEDLPFSDKGRASVYEHILLGLKNIYKHKGKSDLPALFHADWNDHLAIFGDENSGSVMLGMQMVHSLKLLAGFAELLGKCEDVSWCLDTASELTDILNSSDVWDGSWYSRLLLTNGTNLGSKERPEGQIYLTPQAWSVISGVGTFDNRGKTAMDEVNARLNTSRGLVIQTPPYTGIPNPQDPLTSHNLGIGENGGIFCHANTWAIIAECLLGNGDRAFEYYRKILPSVASQDMGQDHWGREPYAFASSINGPACGNDFGKGGISWLTGTAPWMYIAATQYILGIQPTLQGLRINPCIPDEWPGFRVLRRFRGAIYDIEVRNERRGDGPLVIENGTGLEGTVLHVAPKGTRMKIKVLI